MTDTARTRAALEALFPDNASGAISPQDLRDFLASARLNGGTDVFRASGTVTAGTPAFIACDTSTGSIAITLFASSLSPVDGVRRFYRIHNEDHETANTVTVLPPAGETFSCGLTKVVLGSGENVTLSNRYDATASTWVHLGTPPTNLVVGRDTTWAASSFTATSSVQFDSTEKEDNDAILAHSSAAAITAVHGGDYDIAWSATITSTGGSTWQAIGYVAVDGTEVHGTRCVLTNKFSGLPETMTGTRFGVHCTPGQVISLKLGNTSLIGGLTAAHMSVRRTH